MKSFIKVEQILLSCRRYLFKLNNQKGLSFIRNNNIESEEIIKMKEYVEVVQKAIDTIEPDLRKFVYDYYFYDKDIRELHYSQATFYNRKNKALKALSDLLIN